MKSISLFVWFLITLQNDPTMNVSLLSKCCARDDAKCSGHSGPGRFTPDPDNPKKSMGPKEAETFPSSGCGRPNVQDRQTHTLSWWWPAGHTQGTNPYPWGQTRRTPGDKLLPRTTNRKPAPLKVLGQSYGPKIIVSLSQ